MSSQGKGKGRQVVLSCDSSAGSTKKLLSLFPTPLHDSRGTKGHEFLDFFHLCYPQTIIKS